MAQTSTQNSRALVLARRKAMSTRGKAALTNTANTTAAARPGAATSGSGQNAREASRARRAAMSVGGKAAIQNTDRTRAGNGHGVQATATPATPQTKGCGCGCDGTRKECKTQMAEASAATRTPVMPVARKANVPAGRAASVARREAMSTRGKAGIESNYSATAAAQASAPAPQAPVQETQPLAAPNLRASRSTITSTGGVDIATRKGTAVTGDNVGRSNKVTGDESGAQRDPTGTQYATPGSGSAPNKVGVSNTLRGMTVTGTMTGRAARVTGNEPGTCRDVTGDDYIGQEEFGNFCGSTPKPTDFKSGVSASLSGNAVTGTLTDRSNRVTGNEPGTCKPLTGTPYSGADQYQSYCAPEQVAMAGARQRRLRGTPGPSMTGLQPGINGNLTGANKGACEPLTGTPYVGADQFAEACPATAADTASPDFPQGMNGQAPWEQFSINQPSGGAQIGRSGAVTGSSYETGHITGPFGMAEGKITGTEQARFDNQPVSTGSQVSAEQIQGRVKPRISGEGQDAGLNITGDNWERSSHVTGTEGMSVTRRNQTLSDGSPTAMAVAQKRNESMTVPVSKVTGGSGNTEKGSLITYSGGARG